MAGGTLHLHLPARRAVPQRRRPRGIRVAAAVQPRGRSALARGTRPMLGANGARFLPVRNLATGRCLTAAGRAAGGSDSSAARLERCQATPGSQPAHRVRDRVLSGPLSRTRRAGRRGARPPARPAASRTSPRPPAPVPPVSPSVGGRHAAAAQQSAANSASAPGTHRDHGPRRRLAEQERGRVGGQLRPRSRSPRPGSIRPARSPGRRRTGRGRRPAGRARRRDQHGRQRSLGVQVHRWRPAADVPCRSQRPQRAAELRPGLARAARRRRPAGRSPIDSRLRTSSCTPRTPTTGSAGSARSRSGCRS